MIKSGPGLMVLSDHWFLCVSFVLFFTCKGPAGGWWCRTQVLDCAGKLSPLSPTFHLTLGVVPFMQAHRGVLVSFHRCLAVEFKLKKKNPLDSTMLQPLAYSPPRLKIHFIIELDFSHRLLKPPLKDLIQSFISCSPH